jgi:hypothetical protein
VNRSRFVSLSQRTSRDSDHEWPSLFIGAAHSPGFVSAGNETPAPSAPQAPHMGAASKNHVFCWRIRTGAPRGQCRANESAARLTGAGNLTPVAAEGELLQEIGNSLAHGQEFNFDPAFGRDTGYPSSHAKWLG